MGTIDCHGLVDVSDPTRLSEHGKEGIVAKFQGAELGRKCRESVRAEHDSAGLDEIAGH